MVTERWRRVEEIYHAALERPPAEREAFLSDAAHGDEELRRDVQELLSQTDGPAGILDESVTTLIEPAELEPGQTLGPYRILGLIGAGGMGRVYKALDTRLGRTVAIKVSKAGFSGRFRREARAVAALNHPNVCTLFDLGPNYLVMEYVDGAPLRGPMPLPRALSVAIAIADALDAAHRKGVIHRDLKPANVLVTESGPKLLDFGLAKLDASSGGGGVESATFTGTMQATIAGTMQYMSPEQLQGRQVDHRSDIFSFGAMFFEMLTGRPAFEADNSASVIAAILTARPQARALVPQLPMDIERVLDRAMAKNPEDRWQSARDLRAALEMLAASHAAPATPRRHRLAWAFAAVVALAVAGTVWMQWGPAIEAKPEPPRAGQDAARLPRLQWFDRGGRWLGTLGAAADYSNPALSRDGRRLAVSIRGADDKRDIWVFDLDRGAQARLTSDPADETNPVWSPDGTEILYCSDRAGRRDLYAQPSVGGPERLVLSSGQDKNPMDWAGDGSAIYYSVGRSDEGRDLWRLPLIGKDRTPTLFLSGADTRDWLALSPNGRLMLFRVGRQPASRLLLRPLAASSSEWPIGGTGIAEGHWRADGRQFYYISENTMMAQGVESDGVSVRLGDTTALFRVAPNTFGRNAFVVTPDGQRFLVRTGP